MKTSSSWWTQRQRMHRVLQLHAGLLSLIHLPHLVTGHIFLFYCFNASVVIEYVLVMLAVPCKCHSRWASAFLTLPIQAKSMPWTVQLVACFCLNLLYVDFFSASKISVKFLITQDRVLVNVFFLLSIRLEYSCAWKILSFQTCKIFWIPLWLPNNPTY